MFERWRLYPTPQYLANAEDFEDLQVRLMEGSEVFDRIGELDRRLRDTIRKSQRSELARHRVRSRIRELRQLRRGGALNAAGAEELEELEEDTLPHHVERSNDLRDRIEELREERTALARHVDRNFEAVQTLREPDLSAPDEQSIRDQVGRPTGGWEPAVA